MAPKAGLASDKLGHQSSGDGTSVDCPASAPVTNSAAASLKSNDATSFVIDDHVCHAGVYHLHVARLRRMAIINPMRRCTARGSLLCMRRLMARVLFKQVSWIRRRDWHIMSSGTTVYTADSRFGVLNRPGSPDWILMLKSPQLHDSGTYECQVRICSISTFKVEKRFVNQQFIRNMFFNNRTLHFSVSISNFECATGCSQEPLETLHRSS